MTDNRIYADTSQARATDPSAPIKRAAIYGDGLLMTEEQVRVRHELKVARDAEEQRRSNARVRGALAELGTFFAPPTAPLSTAV